jgi:ribose transport system permease protein
MSKTDEVVTQPAKEPAAASGKGIAARTSRESRLLQLLREYSVLVLFLALFFYLALHGNSFLTKSNLLNVLNQTVTPGIIACAGTLVIIAGRFDLSVGAVYIFSGMVAVMASNALGTVPGVAIGLLAGVLVGIANGAIIAYGRVNALVATLASSYVVNGVAALISGGLYVNANAARFTYLGTASVAGVQLSSWIFIVFALVLALVLARTVFGRRVYATGDNPTAARMSGVKVDRVIISTFAISGFAAALAGILVASQTASVTPNTNTGLELTSIAAVVVGGTSIYGGSGAVWRTVVGALFFVLIITGFNLDGINPLYETIVTGAIILIAAAIDARARRLDQ